jgi:hypothetical protein
MHYYVLRENSQLRPTTGITLRRGKRGSCLFRRMPRLGVVVVIVLTMIQSFGGCDGGEERWYGMGSDGEVRSAGLIGPSFAKLQGLSATVPRGCIRSRPLHVRLNATYICMYIAE